MVANSRILASTPHFYVHKCPESSIPSQMDNKPIYCISFHLVWHVWLDPNKTYNIHTQSLYGEWGPISQQHHHNQCEAQHGIQEVAFCLVVFLHLENGKEWRQIISIHFVSIQEETLIITSTLYSTRRKWREPKINKSKT